MNFLAVIVVCVVGLPTEMCDQDASTGIYVSPKTYSSMAACQAAIMAYAPHLVAEGHYMSAYCGPAKEIRKMFGGPSI